MFITRLIVNLVLLLVLITILVAPYALPFGMITYSSPERELAGAILSASTDGFGGYFKFEESWEFFGQKYKITAYAFPGQTVYYRQIFTVKNGSPQTKNYQLQITNVEGKDEEKVGIKVYFGDNPTSQEISLSPSQEVPINLEISSPLSEETTPFPLTLEFSLESSTP